MTGPSLAQQRQFAERMKQLSAAIERVEALADRLEERLDSRLDGGVDRTVAARSRRTNP